MSELITKLNPALVLEAMQTPSLIYTADYSLSLDERYYKNHIYDPETQTGVFILKQDYIPWDMCHDTNIRSAQLLNITRINQSAFDGCSSLTSITIPNSVTSIGTFVFNGCSNLTNITIPKDMVELQKCIFQLCSKLTNIVIPNNITSIGEGAFWNCTSLRDVTMGNNVTSIGKGAFWNCKSLTSITIPDSVTSIGEDAFQDCSRLTSVTIPDSVTSIGESAFYRCASLEKVYCKPITPPSGDPEMFLGNASDRKIFVPIASVEAYKSAQYWSDYADQIVGVVFEDEVLESGKNVKTIGGQSILGEGNIDVLSSVNIATSAEIEALFTNTSSSES